MLDRDFLPESVYGYYKSISTHPIFDTTCYDLLRAEINLNDTYLLLNVQDITAVPRLPRVVKNCIVSFHTEFYKINDLINFFARYPEVNFLLLTDGKSQSTDWPKNVTYDQWMSWGDQLVKAESLYGLQKKYKNKDIKVSSLSFRAELHRAVITGYLLNNYSFKDLRISWFGMHHTSLDYESLPSQLYKWLKHLPTSQISIDDYSAEVNFPLLNGNWHNSAYTDCVFNLTNESIFDNHWTGPYLTEKTWKPLLAGQALLTVGQSYTVSNLSQLGLKFDYGLDFTFDSVLPDFDRLEQIIKILQEINETSIDQLNLKVKESVQHNLNLIDSKEFLKNCINLNIKTLEKIAQWTNQ